MNCYLCLMMYIKSFFIYVFIFDGCSCSWSDYLHGILFVKRTFKSNNIFIMYHCWPLTLSSLLCVQIMYIGTYFLDGQSDAPAWRVLVLLLNMCHFLDGQSDAPAWRALILLLNTLSQIPSWHGIWWYPAWDYGYANKWNIWLTFFNFSVIRIFIEFF